MSLNGRAQAQRDTWTLQRSGNMVFDDGTGMLGFQFFDTFVKHDLDVCVMAMCGADAADWAGTVGEDGIYEGERTVSTLRTNKEGWSAA